MAWYLNNALTTMRGEVNARWPTRDKDSDGTIGDEAHQGTSSDHNPDPDGSVDAWDMDINLYGPSGGKPSSDLEFLKSRFQAHESSKYWIHDRIICSRSTGWARENYTGPNPHDKHIHWNTRPDYEDSTKPWGIKETPVTTAEMEELIDRLLARVVPSSSLGNKPFADWLKGGHMAVRDVGATDDKVEALTTKVDSVKADTGSILTGMQTPVPVEVDAAAVADALAADEEFLAALAKAVNDDTAARLAQ